MKVPPKRKGNGRRSAQADFHSLALNESPSEKEGKSSANGAISNTPTALNESPSEKEGKFSLERTMETRFSPQ